jgi:hypothetical protein
MADNQLASGARGREFESRRSDQYLADFIFDRAHETAHGTQRFLNLIKL